MTNLIVGSLKDTCRFLDVVTVSLYPIMVFHIYIKEPIPILTGSETSLALVIESKTAITFGQ